MVRSEQFLGRLRRAGLNVCPPIRLSVSPSTKSFSYFNEIWYVGRVIHDGMPYDPILGQGHRGPKVAKMTDFKVCLLHRYACNLKTNVHYDISRRYLNFNWTSLWYSFSFGIT